MKSKEVLELLQITRPTLCKHVRERIISEEKYTSGTSFLDGEEPKKEFYNKSRRISRCSDNGWSDFAGNDCNCD